MWKELREINDMFKPLNNKEVVNDDDVIRYQRIRTAKQYFNKLIENYLREKKISIAEITKKDINYLGKNYKEEEREILIQQVMYFLETNFWKPLKRIKENNKSALFKEIDNDGWINTGSEKSDSWAWEWWSIQAPKKTRRRSKRWNGKTNSSTSWELLSS